MISTRDLSALPTVERLKALSQSLALLDAVLCPEWEGRYYSFNAHWAGDRAMASMRTGSGDEYFLLFTPAGAIMKGFAHEAVMSPYAHEPPQVWPGVLDDVPAAFPEFLSGPAFSLQDTTFCIWRLSGQDAWRHGAVAFPPADDPDGSAGLLALLGDRPQAYRAWAEDYYERDIDPAAVSAVYAHRPLTEELIRSLNPDMGLDQLAGDIAEIGYHPSDRTVQQNAT